ncbi:MAG: secondary thiamine-phosphate synthase enzyme YjbQ [Cyclobacteriaceae bacterium]|tara:strand:- start:459 stop:887 length:429 start_codon:yes stop_codon:yes gene_type:complete
MSVVQRKISLSPYPRGFHLITREILEAIPEIRNVKAGLCNVFIQHTSASLTINENADPTVRKDFESHFNKMVPENAPYYLHNYEGPDDIPAHIKASLLGPSVTIPITKGQFNLGIWQGIYLCEHRDHGGSRKLIITIFGYLT